ncbi:hypothetical protein BKA65DRAFT_483347 [Rhexocercosporidium sp. MPI-PUGE-AT-0058]|nr:hypothetical protein BKA65DRAFT_483347 [Rhexocercosporidium sp. MPI-PUGE-AT-0058]
MPTWYCTTNCQKKDLENHNKLRIFIQTRNSLFKVASIFHEVFCQVRDKMLADTTIRLVGKAWVISKKKEDIAVVDTVHMVRLPTGTTAAEINLEELKLYWSALSAGLWANCLVKSVLIRRGITSKVTQLRTETSRSHWSSSLGVTAGNSTKSVSLTHIVLKVEMDNGSEHFVLDFYGHALGKSKVVTPWSQYLEEQIPVSMSADGQTFFGFWREFAMVIDEKENTSIVQYTDSLYTSITLLDDLRVALRSWEAKEKTSWKYLLRLPPAEVESQKRELAKSIVEACTKTIIRKEKERVAEMEDDSDDDKPDLVSGLENKAD